MIPKWATPNIIFFLEHLLKNSPTTGYVHFAS